MAISKRFSKNFWVSLQFLAGIAGVLVIIALMVASPLLAALALMR